MSRNVLILKASPRERGNSAALADQTAAGVIAAGGNAECVFLHAMDIRPCSACDLCKESEAFCVFDDDMQELYPKLLVADAMVLASPVYWFTYSAQLKLCIERWYGMWNHNNDFLKGKPFGILLTYGDPDLEISGGINAVRTFETMCRFLKAPIAGVVHGSLNDPNDALKQPDLLAKAFQLGQTLALWEG